MKQVTLEINRAQDALILAACGGEAFKSPREISVEAGLSIQKVGMAVARLHKRGRLESRSLGFVRMRLVLHYRRKGEVLDV